MPIIWYVREGRRPNTVNDPGIALSFLDFQRTFSDRTPQYLSKQPPEFNVEAPSPEALRVIIEVGPEDGTDLMFPFEGFYLFPDMTPEEAKEELADLFATVTRTSIRRPPK